MRQLPFDGTWAGFRAAARAALQDNVPPAVVRLVPPEAGQGELFAPAPAGA
ncbi:MAG: uracil-DNA glycosylase, partial [Caulobacteraceae bacterium]|nr:uracil-DNA glycosylase [Caulobacter sp.]